MKLHDVVARISPADLRAKHAAQIRQNRLTKPPGSLGRLEDLSVQLAGIFGTESPVPRGKTIVVAASRPRSGLTGGHRLSPRGYRADAAKYSCWRRGDQRHGAKGPRQSGRCRCRCGHAAAPPSRPESSRRWEGNSRHRPRSGHDPRAGRGMHRRGSLHRTGGRRERKPTSSVREIWGSATPLCPVP